MEIKDILRQNKEYVITDKMLVRIYQSYRRVVAICDLELLGKKFEEGNIQLDIREDFYNGERKTEDEVIEIIKREEREDATFNLVGEKSVKAGIKAGIINEEGIMRVQGIPHALSLF
jgi:hypothetical protein